MPTLHWLTKPNDVKAADETPYKLLEEVPDLSAGSPDNENMIIQGDNLEALKALLPFYAGQVKCIYIDPPYNTGSRKNVDGTDVGYDDNLEHTIWLSMMYPRLNLLRELLAEDGLFAVQIDDREFARLFLMLIDLYGEKNLKIICIKMSEASGLKMGAIKKSGGIPKLKEYIILAKKDGIRNIRLDPVPKEKWDKEYNLYLEEFSREDKDMIDVIASKEIIEDSDMEKLDALAANLRTASLVEKARAMRIEEAQMEGWLFENAYRICRTAAGDSVFRLTEEKKKFNKNDMFFVKSVRDECLYLVRATYSETSARPRVQVLFAEDNLKQHPGDLWTDIKTTGLDSEGGIDFKNGKKPESLLYRILLMNTQPGDLVLDSFLGSGTTAAVAHKMKLRYIGIEMGEHAKTHCAVRLQKVIEGEQGGISKVLNWQGGGGFRFYQLGVPVFTPAGRINENVKFCNLAAHVWFAETKVAYKKQRRKSPFLGVHHDTAIALLYNGILGDKSIGGGNVLTSKTLKTIIENIGDREYDKMVVYGESSRIGEAKLKRLKIEFKQIPYEVK
ncbi:MAG: site-specific DNA-methyltransferase [Planctomycetaceae bacterium]|jgi:adenine-specific DNA-methyltransferase|nr:site-specific DNA-methyltransferase [Planctomycetaceae bacterium]